MSKPLQIAQITDCHVPAAPGALYRGQDPRTMLQAVLDEVTKLEPDLLLVTGDMSEDGSTTSYQTLQSMLAQPGVPVLALPGNHDDPVLMQGYFPGSPVDEIAVTDHGDWQIIRLNSCVPGQVHGTVDQDTVEQLEEILGQEQGRPRLVALHHQPLLVGSPWIDKHRLMEPEVFLGLVDRNHDIKAVVWGHIHQVFERDMNGTLMLGGPSSVANSARNANSFTSDSNGPAFRWLEVAADGSVRTSVCTLSAA